MNLVSQLTRWIHRFEGLWGSPPRSIPLTLAELKEVQRITADFVESGRYNYIESQFLGLPLDVSDCATFRRNRMLEIPFSHYASECSNPRAGREGMVDFCHARLDQLILRDCTRLRVVFVRDFLAPLKRRWAWLGRVWPIRTEERLFDCTVLYPYVQVTLPHNRHTLHFSEAARCV